MTRDEQIAALRRARAEVGRVIASCDSPQIEAIARSADMELHWALWNLGVSVPLRAEMDEAARAASA